MWRNEDTELVPPKLNNNPERFQGRRWTDAKTREQDPGKTFHHKSCIHGVLFLSMWNANNSPLYCFLVCIWRLRVDKVIFRPSRWNSAFSRYWGFLFCLWKKWFLFKVHWTKQVAELRLSTGSFPRWTEWIVLRTDCANTGLLPRATCTDSNCSGCPSRRGWARGGSTASQVIVASLWILHSFSIILQS